MIAVPRLRLRFAATCKRKRNCNIKDGINRSANERSESAHRVEIGEEIAFYVLLFRTCVLRSEVSMCDRTLAARPSGLFSCLPLPPSATHPCIHKHVVINNTFAVCRGLRFH